MTNKENESEMDIRPQTPARPQTSATSKKTSKAGLPKPNIREPKILETIHRKRTRSVKSAKNPRSVLQKIQSESEYSVSEEDQLDEQDQIDEQDKRKKKNGKKKTAARPRKVVDAESDSDEDEDGPTHFQHFVYDSETVTERIKKDVFTMQEVPLDFVYKTEPNEKGQTKLTLVPMKTKGADKIIYLKRIPLNRMDYLNQLSKQEDLKGVKAKALRKEIIKNPNDFGLIEITAKNNSKVFNKVQKLMKVAAIEDNRFMFLEIVRSDPKTRFTGKYSIISKNDRYSYFKKTLSREA